MEKPNLFTFATSELSQDAFLAWLLSWADKKYFSENHSLNLCANEVINLFIGKNINIKSVYVERQYEHIDLWFVFNDNISLIIEDKTGTEEHSDQLNRYKAIAKKWCKENNHELYCAFYKTQLFSKTKSNEVRKKGFNVVVGTDLLKILKKYKDSISNEIFNDYFDILTNIENNKSKFLNTPLEKWNEDWNCFTGFFHALENELVITDWNYVPNPSGGFMGAWFNWHHWEDDIYYYLQFENDKLCIKLGEVIEDNPTVRDEAYNILMSKVEKSNYNGKIHKPPRFGNGSYMTLAIIDKELWYSENTNGLINFENTVKNIKKIGNFINKIV